MRKIIAVTATIAGLYGTGTALAQETFDPEPRLAEAGIGLPDAPKQGG